MTNTLKPIIGECVVDINTNELALFDLEYIFCQLRGKSVGEEIELVAKCDTPECKDKKESKTILKINIMNVPVLTPEEHEKKISSDSQLKVEIGESNQQFYEKMRFLS